MRVCATHRKCTVLLVLCFTTSFCSFFIVAASNDHVLSVDKESGEVTVDNPPDYEDFPAGTATADRCHSLTVSNFYPLLLY